MSRWFRYYDEALNDPKVQRLPGELFKAWVNILCLASKSGGEIRSAADVAFSLRVTESKAVTIITDLATRGLLDAVEGRYFAPHNWSNRQFKSDVSNERVKQHRERQRNAECNVTSTVTETPSEQNRTEQIQSRPKSAVENGFKGVKRGSPKHGAISRERGTVFIHSETTDWLPYARDYRDTHGCDPIVNEHGGYWFKWAGAAPLPPPQRLENHAARAAKPS